ncbi:MAG: hypothetical protein AB8H86_23770 [Polyangiales bacterium]
MASKLTDQIVDKRLVERNIRKGLITRKAADKHVADTKDVADNIESVPYYDPEVPEEELAAEGEAAEGAEAPDAPADAPAPAATEGA